TWLHARRKGTPFKEYLAGILWKEEKKSTQVAFFIASTGIAISMLVLAPVLIHALDMMVIFFFQEEGLQRAREGANYITITGIFGPVDVILVIVVNLAFVAFNEELFFRGFFLDVIRGPAWVPVVATSGCFALYHVLASFNPFTILHMFLYYLAWGLILALQRKMSKEQLIFPVITHGLFNILVMFL
nr:CPBP family intramembrane metalloprotease [Candidatus Sigynarchaeota archaeon]